MIVETGHFALILALVLSIVQSVLPLMGAQFHQTSWMRIGCSAARCVFVFLSISFFGLIASYVLSDFSVLNVVRNSHTSVPLLYKISSTWGNHEGSMLFWIWMLGAWGFLLTFAHKKLPLPFLARALSFQGMLGAGFTLFLLFVSNPFARVSLPPLDGMGFNPVLQDLALAIHPPLLYMGYAGLSIVFCFALATLLDGRIDKVWAAFVRPWVLASWAVLTVGITLGSFWAYYELGWGGFWFWDPVENTALMPWLAATALFHTVRVLETRDTLKSWTVFLAILGFALVLLGAFLVRSGVLTSVHSFAVDPARGVFILALLAVFVGGAFSLYAFRVPPLSRNEPFEPVSRETFLLLNNVFLFTFCMTVLTGTLYPLILSVLNAGDVSVGPPYYVTTMLPLFVPFALLMGAAPYLSWRKGNLATAGKKLLIPLLLTIFCLAWVITEKALVLLGVGTGSWILWAVLGDLARKKGRRFQSLPWSYYGMACAHAGFACLILGVTAVTQFGIEKTIWMRAGDTVTVSGQHITFLGVYAGLGPDYNTDKAVFSLKQKKGNVILSPEKRYYPVTGKDTTETALYTRGLDVFYFVLGDRDLKDGQRWVVRLYHHPFVWLIFMGGGLMALGGFLSINWRRAYA